jgi:hypothetical protein
MFRNGANRCANPIGLPRRSESFQLKHKGLYVRNHLTSSLDSPTNWRPAYLASQPGLGILSHWWPWAGSRHFDYSVVARSNLRGARIGCEMPRTNFKPEKLGPTDEVRN